MKFQILIFSLVMLFDTNLLSQTDLLINNDSTKEYEIEDPLLLYDRINFENLKSTVTSSRSLKTHKLDSSYFQYNGISNPNLGKEGLTLYLYDKAKDTISGYGRTVGENTWRPSSYSTYTYNKYDQITDITFHYVTDTTLDLSSKLDAPIHIYRIYKYDSDNRQIRFEGRLPQDTSFIITQEAYSYDNAGNLDSVQVYFYHDGIWTHRRSTKYYHSLIIS